MGLLVQRDSDGMKMTTLLMNFFSSEMFFV